LQISRYATHLVVLVLALALSGYATLDRHLVNLRLGEVNSEGLLLGQGGQVGGVQVGRSSTIDKPLEIPTSAPIAHTPISYDVQSGETLKDLAARFGITVEDIRWSNFTALKSTTKDVTAGMRIMIPPLDGVVVTAQQGDTPLSLGNAYHVQPEAIVDFNWLRTTDQDPVPAGTVLVIPGGKGPSLLQPRSTLPSYTGGFGGYSVGPFTGSWSVAAGNRFPYGYCTWYAYNRKPVPWMGNAWQWFGAAVAAGWSTGQTPKVGAIMVTWESGFGHVAYVESVGTDGSWSVSEMNFVGWGVVDLRHINKGGVPLIGFIY
jgi:LysM repeat protein